MSSNVERSEQEATSEMLPAEKSTAGVRWKWIILSTVLSALIGAVVTIALAYYLWELSDIRKPVLLDLLCAALAAVLVNLRVKHSRRKHTILAVLIALPLAFVFLYLLFMIWMVIFMMIYPMQ